MNKIVFASGNAHKLKEIRQMFPEIEIMSCADAGFNGDIEETGKTFFENALIKAKTVSEFLGVPTIADDSGLCVDALSGAPGIYSARYAGDGDSAHNNSLLLENMKDKTDRKAKFVCVLVYYFGGKIITAEGTTEGSILYEPQGKCGFGYDPIFYSGDLKKPMGLATADEKNSVSHRSRALAKLKEKLKKEKII